MASTDSATIVFSTVFGMPSSWFAPRARNSNLLPVKANGLVRLRSPACSGMCGSTGVPKPRNDLGVLLWVLPLAIAWNTRSISEPR